MKLIDKIENVPAPLKAATAFLIMNIIQKGLSFLTSPLYTRILTTEEYGQVSVFMTWQSLIGVVAMLCLSYGVFNNGMLDYREDRDSFSFSLLLLSNIATIITFVLIIIGYRWVQPYSYIELPLIILMFVVFLTQPALNFWSAQQRFEYKYKMVSVVTVLTSIFSPLVAIICVLNMKESKVYARLIGGESVLIFCYTIIYIYIAYKAKFKIKIIYWKYSLAFNMPLIPHYLSMYVLNTSDRLMISSLENDTGAALYSVAYAIASIVTILWAAVNSSLIPYTYEKCEARDYKSLSKITMPILTVYAAACLVIVVFAPEILKIMAPDSYRRSIYVIPAIIGGVFFSALYNVFANVVYYYKKPKYVMVASVTSALLNILLNWFFIPIYGFVAAGYTTLVCYMLQATIDFFAMKKVAGDTIYNMKYLLILSGVVTLFSLISNFGYDYPVIRYGVLVIITIVAVLLRKKIIFLLLSIKNKLS